MNEERERAGVFSWVCLWFNVLKVILWTASAGGHVWKQKPEEINWGGEEEPYDEDDEEEEKNKVTLGRTYRK